MNTEMPVDKQADDDAVLHPHLKTGILEHHLIASQRELGEFEWLAREDDDVAPESVYHGDRYRIELDGQHGEGDDGDE